MSEPSPRTDESRGLAAARRIDAIANRFEDAWKSGQRPAIEGFLADVPDSDHAALLRELITLDIDYRRRRGEVPHTTQVLTEVTLSGPLVQ
jgi:hypothetical protein